MTNNALSFYYIRSSWWPCFVDGQVMHFGVYKLRRMYDIKNIKSKITKVHRWSILKVSLYWFWLSGSCLIDGFQKSKIQLEVHCTCKKQNSKQYYFIPNCIINGWSSSIITIKYMYIIECSCYAFFFFIIYGCEFWSYMI